MNIFCGGLPFRIEEAELKEIFEEYGEVSSVRIITDKFSGRSKGYGFVEMPNDDQANAAIKELNGAQIGGRAIAVSQAQERKESGEGFRSGNRQGGGNYKRGGGNFRRKDREEDY